jgi:hypothetical protein
VPSDKEEARGLQGRGLNKSLVNSLNGFVHSSTIKLICFLYSTAMAFPLAYQLGVGKHTWGEKTVLDMSDLQFHGNHAVQ